MESNPQEKERGQGDTTNQEAREDYGQLSAERSRLWTKTQTAYANLLAAQQMESQAFDAWISATSEWREACEKEAAALAVICADATVAKPEAS